MTKHYQFKAVTCPHCGKPLDSFMLPNAAHKPQAGTMGVCSYCGQCLIFGLNMELRKLSEDEIAALPEKKRASLLRSSRFVIDAQGGHLH